VCSGKFLWIILTHCHSHQNNASTCDGVGETVRLTLSRRGKVEALGGLVHPALQYFAMLIHLAQFALRIDFILAVYQQVIHNQSTARANAEPEFYDCRR
jgi:hypothetical protein